MTMHTTEITPIDVIEVLLDNGFVTESDADRMYCDILRDTAENEYAQQMKKPAEFLTKKHAKSICLFKAWEAVNDMQQRHFHELMVHVIGLVALYIHCTEDMDKDALKSYTLLRPVDTLLRGTYDWKTVRNACCNVETCAKGRHSFVVCTTIRYCLAKLTDEINKSTVSYTSREFALSDIEDMFKKYSQK